MIYLAIVPEGTKKCPNCKGLLNHNFCPVCGCIIHLVSKETGTLICATVQTGEDPPRHYFGQVVPLQ